MKNIFVCLFGVLLLSGCVTTMDSPDGYRVKVEDQNHPGTFCPPGQAKKGNC